MMRRRSVSPRPDLIDAHEPAVAGHVGRKDRGKAAFEIGLVRQNTPLKYGP
jgi:hypothetical protein